VSLKAPYSNTKVSCRGSQISSAIDGDRLRVNMSRLDSYAAIVIEPSAG